MRRLPLPHLVEGTRTLPGDAARYLARVLRLKVGDRFEAFDPQLGDVANGAVISIAREEVVVAIEAVRHVAIEPPLVLVQGYPKGDKLGDVVRDATELGVTLVIPAICTRSIARPEGEKLAARADRLQAIAQEAARQCGRSHAPAVLAPMPWADALEMAAGIARHRFVAWEKATALIGDDMIALSTPDGVAFAIGPEGGLTDEEVARATEHQFAIRSLGPIVLRTETAATAILGAFRIVSAR